MTLCRWHYVSSFSHQAVITAAGRTVELGLAITRRFYTALPITCRHRASQQLVGRAMGMRTQMGPSI
jgi:hypothetical protein